MSDLPETTSWIERELASCRFADERLRQRFRKLLEQLGGGLGQAIPLACQDWTNTKAAYRFFSNSRVHEQTILEGHFAATRERFVASQGPILVLHDTTEFSYQRQKLKGVGALYHYPHARRGFLTFCGLLMHSSLAVTTEGLPLGLTAVRFWTRKKFKGTNALKRSVNPTRVPIEQKESVRWLENLRESSTLLGVPERCVHIGDRESDIYELFCAAQEASTHFVLRTCVDRLADDGQKTVATVMQQVPVKAVHSVEITEQNGTVREAVLEIKYRRLRVYAPRAKQKRYGPLRLTVIQARERDQPSEGDRIDWKLITNLTIRSRAEAIEKLNWYAMRWKIEQFHKILKSGCRAEESKLRTADRLVNLLALLCLLAWRLFWLTMMNRTAPQAPPTVALTPVEVQVLDRLVLAKNHLSENHPTLTTYLTKVARLGGYLARAHDPPPGNIVLWRGLARLTDIEIGFSLGAQLVGN
ncbi:MAG: IS4 family transposase [Acidobacteriaceae bacterium]|nr:IS4 family transposase [Acidobacteriaceae bacterium]MBV9305023.1 IS4 family transposase [Acidobacteriaceae bacterium]MBV9675936.1 IS4 family transposase [Acidobacteriaceae bacterium]MBV9936858.1 IS4 family transposase [Acidobacteriaceae bacterium]